MSESEGIALTDHDGLQRLYETVARLLGSDVPSVDFEKYRREFKDLEEAYERQRPPEDAASGDKTYSKWIPKPRVLCVTSDQFKKIGFENQLQMVINAFPSDLSHEVVMSSAELRRILTTEHVDILHIVAFVCPRGGSVYFSPVELSSGRSLVPDDEIDKVGPEALVALLEQSGTALVVVGACESLALGAILLTATDVIAANDMVSTKSMAAWVETFYAALKTKSLADAYNLATQVSRAPVKLYGRQKTLPSLHFTEHAESSRLDARAATAR